MPFCPHCGTSNREGSKFCNFCGTALTSDGPIICTECNAANPSMSKFCNTCGAKLTTGMRETRAQATPAPVSDSDLDLPDVEALKDELPPFEAEIPSELLFEVLSLSEGSSYIPETENPAIKPVFDPESHIEKSTDYGPLEEQENPPSATGDSDTSTSPEHELRVPPREDLEAEQSEIGEQGDSQLPEWLDYPEPQEFETATSEFLAQLEQYTEQFEAVEPATLPAWLDLKDTEEQVIQDESLNESAGELSFSQELPPGDQVVIDGLPSPEVKSLPDWLDLEDHPESPEASTTKEDTDDLPVTADVPEWLLLKPSGEPDVEPLSALETEPVPLEPEITEEPTDREEQDLPGDFPPIDLESVGVVDVEQDSDVTPETLEVDSDQSPLGLDEITGNPFSPSANPELGELGSAQQRSVSFLSENGLIDEKGESIVSPEQQISISKTFQDQGDQSPFMPPDVASNADILPEKSTEKISPQQDEKRAGNNWPRIISFILLFAVTAPFFFPLRLAVSASSNTASAYQAINQVPSNSTVLVSFDWDGANNDEMTPIALAILNHLASRKVRIIAVSLTPEGSQIAQQILSRLEESGYRYGTDFVNLGFVAGEKAGIQSMVRSFSITSQKDYFGASLNTLVLTKQVLSIRDTSMVISLAGNPERIQDWVTQLSAVLPDQRIVGGMTALGAPAVQPFVQSNQLLGLVAGLPGATEYEWQSGKSGLGLATVDAQSLASLAVVALVIGANVATLVRRAR